MLKRLFVTVAGTALALIGVIGVFLPILPGVLFIAAGLAMLATQYAWAGAALEPLRRWRATAGRRYRQGRELDVQGSDAD